MELKTEQNNSSLNFGAMQYEPIFEPNTPVYVRPRKRAVKRRRHKSDLYITRHTSRYFVVYGADDTYRSVFTSLQGKYCTWLRNGTGWLFPNHSREKVERLIYREKVDRSITEKLEKITLKDILKNV